MRFNKAQMLIPMAIYDVIDVALNQAEKNCLSNNFTCYAEQVIPDPAILNWKINAP